MPAPTVVKLTVNNADNELAAYLNCVPVYDKKTEGNPTFNDVVDLTPFLKSGCCCNCLVLIGINWGGPATFNGSLTIGTLVQPFAVTFPSTPNGIAFTRFFYIPY
jgi:hypothetical protein